MKQMTYIKLFAGLGNQIFQYIYGLYNELNRKKVIYILSKSKNDITEIFDLKDIKIFAPQGKLKKLRLLLKKIWAKYIIRSYETGFYQEVRFVDCVNEKLDISKVLKFKNIEKYNKTKVYESIKKNDNSISIHIRGGDYLTAQDTYGGICTAEYYKKAIDYFNKKMDNCFFYIFTNDVEYSQELLSKINFDTENFVIVQPEEDYCKNPGYDLYLMSKCKHNIIANSTFSWWGAYLNHNANKIVITPSKWTNKEKNTLELIKPENWISL